MIVERMLKVFLFLVLPIPALTQQSSPDGLSLSYDIIKAHGGELKVETQEGKGSAFVIQLPI